MNVLTCMVNVLIQKGDPSLINFFCENKVKYQHCTIFFKNAKFE